MKTVGRWILILCIIGWAGQNPAAVQAGAGQVMTLGRSVVSSVMAGVGSAVSGATGGTAPAAPAPAPLIPAAPAPAVPAR